jgi:hypothetical protein
MPEFGNTPGRDRCLQTLTYELTLTKADDIAGDFPIPMYKITGSLNETRKCRSKTYVDQVLQAGGGIKISNTQFPPGHPLGPTCAPPPGATALFQVCPEKDKLKESSQGITNAVLNILKENINCDTVTPGCLHNLLIDGECRYDLGPCGGIFGFEQGSIDGPGECDFVGPFDMKQEGFPGLDFTPGTDVPFGLIPQNLCDYSDYNTNCNLFNFIAEELAKVRPRGKYADLIISIVEAYINSQTGGLLTEVQGFLQMMNKVKLAFDFWQASQGNLPLPQLQQAFGEVARDYNQAIELAYIKYLNCLRSELSV